MSMQQDAIIPLGVQEQLRVWQAQADLKGLVDGLLPASSISAQQAVQAFIDGDDAAACASAGQAVELLSKALLVRINPMLILADAKDLPSVFYLSGLGHVVQRGRKPSDRLLRDIKTISGEEAYARAAAISGQRVGDGARERDLFRARGGALHLGYAVPSSGRLAVGELIILARPLLTHLVTSPEDWFGDLLEFAAAAEDRTIKETAIRVASKRKAALEHWQEQKQKMTVDALNLLSRALLQLDGSRDDHYAAACLTGDHDAVWIGEWEDSEDQDYGSGYRCTELSPIAIECPVCGLDLDYDELVAADVSRVPVEEAWVRDHRYDPEEPEESEDEPGEAEG